MRLEEDERGRALALHKEESRPARLRDLRGGYAPNGTDAKGIELVDAWLTLSGAERQRAERELPEGLRAEVLGAVRDRGAPAKGIGAGRSARKRSRTTSDRCRGAVHRAACSGLSRQDMRLAGLSKSECDEAMSMRKDAMTLTAAAEYIAVPKGRLDRWERSGLAKCSFTRKISMAKIVTARFWTKRDADWIKWRVPMLKAHDAARQKKARREGKNASVGS